MPFKSEKQRRYLFANEPEVAKRWTDKYGSKPQPKKKTKLKLMAGFIKSGKVKFGSRGGMTYVNGAV